MAAVFAVLLLITAVVTVAYWVDFFVRGTVNVVDEQWYIRFERAFPVADGFMSVCCLVSAIGLLQGSAYGTAFGLVAAGALLFLGLMDITFNVENGLYRFLPGSSAMWGEVVINVWSVGFGAALLVAMLLKAT